MSAPSHADVLVVGGGLAGAAAAIDIARAGRQVVLLEKSRSAHHKVCGEFLSAEALHYLARLGVDVDALGAVPIRRVRLFSRGLLAETPMPFAAKSLTRMCLDEVLLQRAAAAGVEVRRGSTVDRMEQDTAGWRVDVREGSPVLASEVVLATGKHDLRGQPRGPGMQGNLVGMKMYFRLSPQQAHALGEAVELALFPGGYAGLQPVEEGAANLCLVVTSAMLRRVGGGWPALLHHLTTTSPVLAERLEGATALLAAPLAISAIPYGYVCSASRDGAWRVGDQAAVIPSFCGDGMSIALHSGCLAAHALQKGQSASAFQAELAGQLRTRVRFATRISQLLVRLPLATEPVRWCPSLLSTMAFGTRIPERHLLA